MYAHADALRMPSPFLRFSFSPCPPRLRDVYVRERALSTSHDADPALLQQDTERLKERASTRRAATSNMPITSKTGNRPPASKNASKTWKTVRLKLAAARMFRQGGVHRRTSIEAEHKAPSTGEGEGGAKAGDSGSNSGESRGRTRSHST